MSHPLLACEKISKCFEYPQRVQVLQEVNLSVDPGETVAIMGASGEGKSTLLQILGTLERASTGRLHIAGREVMPGNEPAIRSRHIGFIFQGFFLLEDYTALENVLMPARIARKRVAKSSNAYERAHALLEAVGLHERLRYPTKLLSGGEKQRVAIARALCNDPDLLLADEPSGNLDHGNSKAIHELLLGLAASKGKALITVTHDQELAALCDHCYLLRDGKLQAQ